VRESTNVVGWILMGDGLASVLLSLLFWQSWAGLGGEALA
jgi:hypothetical protein